MKNQKRITQKTLITVSAFLLISVSTHAQNTAAKLEEQFNSYNKKVLQEKMFMHTDRNFYLAGDIIWFKLYNVDASFHQPLGISKVAYAEILDANNTPVLQTKVGLEDGRGNGSVYLPVTIASGNYKLRAYTNWMKNFGADYFFEKTITIVNTQKKRELASPSKQLPPDVHFFPEGGNMVYGISSKIACKVVGADGKGLTFQGNITDEQNNNVVSFRSLEYGMGSFDFTPQPGHTYKATIDIGSTKLTKELPEIYKQGYVMHLNANREQVTVDVNTNVTTQEDVYLLVHTRQSLKTVLKASMPNGHAVFSVSQPNLGDGISQFTLFTGNRQPVCERLYFKYPSDQLTINIAGNNHSYKPRTKIDLDIKSADQDGKQLPADMSMAVYNINALQTIDENNINNFLWLTSDIKGHIESPGFYFENVTADVIKAMDNLMLTQGWRRFHWDDVLADKTPAFSFPPEYNGHIITGKVVSNTNGAPVADIETFASFPGLTPNFLAATSDAAGKIKFDFKKMRGSSEIIVQANPRADTTARVEIANPFFESYTDHRLPVFRLSKTNENILLDESIGTQVQNVYAGEKLKRFTQSTDTTAFYGKPDNTYFLDDYTRFTTMEEVLREYVMFMDVRKSKGKFSIPLMNMYSQPIVDLKTPDLFEVDPLIMVDGVPVFDVDKLMSFEPLKMKKLEVVNKRYFLGNSDFEGIMNWKTYKGDLANFEIDPHATVIDYEGLQLEREFYSPSYDSEEKIASHVPDFRNVLYWSPDVRTNEKGQKHISFYTSDKKGTYVAVLQGLSARGQSGTQMIQFEVK